MAKKVCCWTLLPLLCLALGVGCGEMGKVDQGRVISFDPAKQAATFIRDVKSDPNKPDYSQLPPVTYTLPQDPQETGPLPKAGKRMNLDTQKRVITIFDTASQGFKQIPYTLIDQQDNVPKDSPLVAGKQFPTIDRDKKTITIYSGRQKILTTFSLPDEYFSLPDDTWDSGDEVRVYYKEPGKALRFMNISKTDIFKK
jgi:hypothetical protein